MAFEAVAENFVEEDSGGSAGKHGGTGVRICGGSGAKRFQVGGDLVHSYGEIGVGRKLGGSGGLKGFDAHQFHAIVGAGFGLNDQARDGAGTNQGAAFAGGQVGAIGGDIKGDVGGIDLRIFQEAGGNVSGAGFPDLLVGGRMQGNQIQMILRSFAGEIGRFILLFGAHRVAGFHFQKCGGGLLVFTIGKLPEDAGDGVRVIIQREQAGSDPGSTALAVRVVERDRAYAHHDVCLAAVHAGGIDDAAVGGGYRGFVGVGYSVAHVVGCGVGLG